MLKDSLYKITSLIDENVTIRVRIEINSVHEIFSGHFPNQPVLPGACMLQIIKEILESTLLRKLQLQKADNLKFIQLIDPQINNVIDIKLMYKWIDYKILYVNGNFNSAEAIIFKFQGAFI